MGYGHTKCAPCADCGVQVVKRTRPMVAWLCTECAQKRAIIAARSMAARSGPHYERFVASRRARAERERAQRKD